jgi:hypothetical protein
MGKPKYIESPERMRELFIAYQKVTKENPILVQDFVGKDGDEVNRKRERPLTMEGFENYLFEQDVITDVSDYFENKDDRYKDYIPICRAIRKIIRQDQIEGGMAGIYNPSITQRLNGLVDKVQNNVIHEQPLFPDAL